LISLTHLAPAFYDRMEKRIRPTFLTAIKDWRNSDCRDPARFPSPQLAPNWQGPAKACHIHGASCNRCHSCSACRPEQREPKTAWDDWLFLAGRGAGKTRSAAELVAEKLATQRRWRICILAPTYADARDICVEGESGLIAVFERWGWVEGDPGKGDYTWNRSLGEVKIHSTRSQAKLFSAEKPARLRGPQHHYAWVEELAQVVRDAPDAWDMMKFGLRLGRHPQCVATTTPLPLHLIKDLLVDPSCAVSRGTTDTNAANLPAVTLKALHKKYSGTRLGRQEMGGELLDDVPGALWKRSWFDNNRVPLDALVDLVDELLPVSIPEDADDTEAERIRHTARVRLALSMSGITLVRIVVALDPAVTASEDSDESGIVVVGLGDDDQFYVLEDRSLREMPADVMDAVIDCYDRWRANGVVVEVNNGGKYIPAMLDAQLEIAGRRRGSIPIEEITAKQGKRVRAEPVSALSQKGHVHVVGELDDLEDQCCVWEGSKKQSPDRMDAFVYGVLHLDEQGGAVDVQRPAGNIPRHQGGPARMQMPTTSVGSRR
jgi:phage terminase large subunit-like protein